MFGFQRTGDQIWALGDARGRGFLMGATAGRTTLTGEGLQHDDGHSHILASTVPNVRAYDPAYAYELAAIVRDGIERMYVEGRGRLLLRHALQRELRPAAEARRHRRGDPPRHLPASRGARPRAEGAPGAARRVGVDPPAGGRGPGPPRREVRDRGRGLLGAVVPAPAARRARGRALEPAPPGPRRRGCPYVSHGPRAGRRPDRRRHRLAEGPARHGLALAAALLRRRSGPTASDGAGPARTSARCSRSTRRTSRPRRSSSSPAAVPSRRTKAADAIRELGIDPEKLDPVAL